MVTFIEEARLLAALPTHDDARAIRERAGIGVERLAHELGVSRQTLSQWESGQRKPRGAARLRYARLLAALKEVIEAA